MNEYFFISMVTLLICSLVHTTEFLVIDGLEYNNFEQASI